MPAGPFSSPAEAVAKLPPHVRQIGAFLEEHGFRRTSDGKWEWQYDSEGTVGGAARSMADPRRWDWWRRVQCPTLLVRGGNSLGFPQIVAEEMCRENHVATLVVIPDAGHFIALEQPLAFEQAVREWLNASDGQVSLA
jgi:pimeloyl-ACP methyl ester carboxylesterase